ncbi:MAG: hypothetical protein CMI15_13475 [Opitutaceae bacterium]|nr:hypothetical protein [Opitutaceae bacterium]
MPEPLVEPAEKTRIAATEPQQTEIEASAAEEVFEEEKEFYEAPIIEKGEDPSASSSDRELPPLISVEEAEALIPDKTKLLMDELFRARIQRVKRIDPKEIR